jgi:hypothetical protein
MQTVKLTLHISTLEQLSDAIEMAECLEVRYELETKRREHVNGAAVAAPAPDLKPKRKRRKPRRTYFSNPNLIVKLDKDRAQRFISGHPGSQGADALLSMIEHPYPAMTRAELAKTLCDATGYSGHPHGSSFPKLITTWLNSGALYVIDNNRATNE